MDLLLGRSGGGKDSSSRPSTAPGGKQGTGSSGKKCGGNSKQSSGSRAATSGSEKPKPMPKMTILQRKPAAAEASGGGQRQMSAGNAPTPSNDQAGARDDGGKKGQGNNKNKPKKDAPNPSAEGDSVGRFKQQGEERKKKRTCIMNQHYIGFVTGILIYFLVHVGSQMRSSNEPKQASSAAP